MKNVLAFLTVAKWFSLKYRQCRENRKLFFNWKYVSQLRCDHCISRFSPDCQNTLQRQLKEGMKKRLTLAQSSRMPPSWLESHSLRSLRQLLALSHYSWNRHWWGLVLSAQYPLYFILWGPGPQVHRMVVPTFRMGFTAQLNLPRNTRLDAATGGFSPLFYIQTW